MKRRWILVALLLVAVGMLVGCGSAGPKVDWTLKVNGAVDKPLELSYAELVKMEQVELNDVLMLKSQGEDQMTAWSGVSLDKVLETAGANPDYVAIEAMAGDGYALEVTRDELAGAIIALKDSEGWIAETDAEHGPIRIVCPNAPGNRWVFQLQQLKVIAP